MKKLAFWGGVALLIYVIYLVGLPTVANVVDPGGDGQPLLARLPRATWHVGAGAAFVGFILCIVPQTHETGKHMMGWGALAFVVGILGPAIMAWFAGNGPPNLTQLLNGHLPAAPGIG